ncbi:DNA-directed RNA polymerase sigma-70 factor [Echinicola pacifica]|uniref:DNA-directed RNA polymerase sigma-70 factor n=1 Tax=Echinicola pacifica TaxID=346377 RepID=A0A918PL40_9BACT|nr:RNA polymerase sigma-70 factor [Echinicola pacifica]GGZ14855.1 DNA-directed RNA polymerase sigma-70 factor [Echinicola pacifica]
MSYLNTHFEEKTLIKSLKKGDEKAFKAAYDLFFPSLFRYSIKFLKSKELAEEVVHDVFLKLWNHRERLHDDGLLSPFLYKICKNHILNTLEKASKNPVLLNEITAAQIFSKDTGPEDLLIARELESSIKNAIDSLPPIRQHVFKLCRVEGKSYEEAASILGITTGTVNSHIIKANRSLKAFLKLSINFLLISLSVFLMN